MIWKAIAVTLLGAVLVSGHAISEQKVVKYFRGHHGHLTHVGESKPEHHEEYAWAYPAYEFSYKVEDPHTHDFKGQQESRDGDVVKGEYWLLQPDGRKRIVKYHADKHSGFKAEVHYEGEAHHPPQEEVKHHIPHKPHVEHKIVVEHKHIEREREPERREPERREPERREPERREEIKHEPKTVEIHQKIRHVIPKHEEHKSRLEHWPQHESRDRGEEREREREPRRERQREEEEEERVRIPNIREPYYGHRRYYRHSKSQQ